MEVRTTDAEPALKLLEEEYLRTTGLSGHDLRLAAAVFDENAATTVCPACGTAFVPDSDSTCPECGLNFGGRT